MHAAQCTRTPPSRDSCRGKRDKTKYVYFYLLFLKRAGATNPLPRLLCQQHGLDYLVYRSLMVHATHLHSCSALIQPETRHASQSPNKNISIFEKNAHNTLQLNRDALKESALSSTHQQQATERFHTTATILRST